MASSRVDCGSDEDGMEAEEEDDGCPRRYIFFSRSDSSEGGLSMEFFLLLFPRVFFFSFSSWRGMYIHPRHEREIERGSAVLATMCALDKKFCQQPHDDAPSGSTYELNESN